MPEDPNADATGAQFEGPADMRPEVFIDGDGAIPSRAGGNRPPMRPGARRWVAVGIAIILVFFVGFAIGTHLGGQESRGGGVAVDSTAPPSTRTTSPTTSASSPRSAAPAHSGPEPSTTTLVGSESVPLAHSSGWELVGVKRSGDVVRYEPSTGALTTTPVPSLNSGGPLSVVFTRHAAIVRPWDFVPGYVVVDDKQAAPLVGALATGALVFPGPDVNHVWVTADDRTSLREVDADGKPTGRAIPIPDELQIPVWTLTPDGAGYVLGRGPDGTYDLRPSGAHLVTHGRVIAAGPTGYVVENCDDATGCGLAVIDREAGTSTAVSGSDSLPQGLISPDGGYAAVSGLGSRSVTVLNLATGQATTTPGSVGRAGLGYVSRAAFTPDGRYLLVATADGVTPIDTASLTAMAPVPIPGLLAIAVRSTG